jgi:sarcosine oxidase subunit gamma
VSDSALAALAPLDSFRFEAEGVTVAEIDLGTVFALSAPLGGGKALRDALRAAYGLDWPATGRFVQAEGVRLLGLASDQAFLVLPPGALPADGVATAGYVFEQSDAWAALALEGAEAGRIMERLCMLDLDGGGFPPGSSAQTLMEHQSVILIRETDRRYLLMSSRSSAGSFLDAVMTSVRNILAAGRTTGAGR